MAKDTGLGNQLQFIPHIQALIRAGHEVFSDSDLYCRLGICGVGSAKSDWNIVLFGYGVKKFARVKLDYAGKFIGYQYRVKGKHYSLGYDQAFRFDPDRSEVEQNDEILNFFGLTREGYSLQSHYWWHDTDKKDPKLVVIGASGKTEKKLPEDYWSGLVGLLLENGYEVKTVDYPILGGRYHVETPTVEDLAFEINRATYYIGVDSGPMHLADLLEMKMVIIFGPTSSEKNKPINSCRILKACEGTCYNWGRYACAKNFSCYESLDPYKVVEYLNPVIR